jgi:hypothetical protein
VRGNKRYGMREGEGERKWMGVYRSERLGMREIWNEIRRGSERE